MYGWAPAAPICVSWWGQRCACMLTRAASSILLTFCFHTPPTFCSGATPAPASPTLCVGNGPAEPTAQAAITLLQRLLRGRAAQAELLAGLAARAALVAELRVGLEAPQGGLRF